jgi:hypothetical protein
MRGPKGVDGRVNPPGLSIGKGADGTFGPPPGHDVAGAMGHRLRGLLLFAVICLYLGCSSDGFCGFWRSGRRSKSIQSLEFKAMTYS